jgi:hypothetical protein
VVDQAVIINLTNVLQGIILAAVIGVGRVLYSMNQHLALLNGRLGKMETWKEEHAKLEDAMDGALRSGELECKANFRREIDALWGRLGDRRTNFKVTD